MNRLTGVFVLCAALAGCATGTTFNLGSVSNSQGQSRETMTNDWNTCQTQAKAQAESGKDHAVQNALGASVVGYQAGVQHEVDAQRAYFRQCMEARGYAYTAPKD
jgi:hypothetical protein